MMHVQLPNRSEITLREAVTAFVHGESRDTSSGPLYPSNASETLLERLHQAARAGQVRFRALKIGDNTYQEIDPLYFGTRRELNWNKNQILSYGPVDEQECKPVYDGEECDEVLGVEWYDVHLDREQFASLLREMGVLVQQKQDTDIEQNVDADRPTDLSSLETSGTGLAGRPTSVQFVLPMAQERLDAGDYPDSKTEFAEQLAKAFKEAAPRAHYPQPKTLMTNAEFGEMWRRRKPRKDPS
jgi:hypothetical protein